MLCLWVVVVVMVVVSVRTTDVLRVPMHQTLNLGPKGIKFLLPHHVAPLTKAVSPPIQQGKNIFFNIF